MIVFAGFTPHSPLLLPSIGKQQREKLTNTVDAMQEMADDLYAAQPDTVVIISAHTDRYKDAFTINLHDPYGIDLSEFGDVATQKTFRPNIKLIDRIQRDARNNDIPLSLNTNPNLDYGSAVPLMLLAKQLPDITVVPISYSNLDKKSHVAFGRALKDVLSRAPDRIAVFASGDLSHCLTSDAPVEYAPEGERFDAAVQEAVKEISTANLLNIDEAVVEKASECAYEPLLILFGVLERMSVRTNVLSYEAPFGVGYLVAQFETL